MENPFEEIKEGEKLPLSPCRLKKWKTCAKIAAFFCIALGVGFAIGWWANGNFDQGNDATQDSGIVVRANTSNYRFVNPLLECDMGPDVISKNRPKPSKTQLQNMISDIETQGRASFVAVYYRDLNNGPWVGINQSEPFYPASLLKVPVMMYYYKWAETDPSILSQKVVFETSNTSTQIAYYKPDQVLENGKTYTVDELINHMIIYSDNSAAEALMSLAQPKDPVQEVFQSIGLKKDASSTSTQINIMDYAMILRILFNSSYLNPDSSERALNLLSQTTFDQGIIGELPDGITVSHKFGERESDDGTRQLHDCGIVYKTNFPYLVCVMTRGSDMDKLSGVIQDISKEIYDEVSQNEWKP